MTGILSQAESYVLNIVVNDFESLDTIRREAADWSMRDGKMLAEDETTAALLHLMDVGLIQAFRYEGSGYVARNVRVPHELHDYWFMATVKGVEVASSI